MIINGLHHNTTLKKLLMSGSHFYTFSLASVVSTNHTLVSLDLGYCNIDSDGACQLVSALCTNNTLQQLNLRQNLIGVQGATAFAEMLLKNKTLKELNLEANPIGEEGTQKLIGSLTHNTTVEQLHLPKQYDPSIDSSGVDSSRVIFSHLVLV